MNKDYPIGTIIKWSETETLVVTPVKGNIPACTRCFFSDNQRRRKGLPMYNCYNHLMSCTSAMRKDKRHVIFKEV